MTLGRVVGTVVATRKEEKLQGFKLDGRIWRFKREDIEALVTSVAGGTDEK